VPVAQRNSPGDAQTGVPKDGAEAAGASMERTLFRTGLAAAAVALAVFALPLFTNRVYTENDLGWFHLPTRYFYSQCLAHGDSPAWFPNIFCGFYLHGEGQVGMYHPLHFVLYGLLPFVTAFNIDLVWPYPFMMAGMYVFLRRWGIRRDAALFGGITFAFSGFNLLHAIHMNGIAVVSHIPWLLAAIDAAIRPGSSKRTWPVVAISLLTASQILLGYPQYFWFSSLAELIYALSLGIAWGAWRALPLLALAKVLGALMGCVQLIPTIDLWSNSLRAFATKGFFDRYSLMPVNAFQFVAPYVFKDRSAGGSMHEYGIYDGVTAVLLICWLLANARRIGAGARLAAGALAAGLFFLVLSFGKYGLLYSAVTALPVVGSFRAPCRYMSLVHLCMAVAAAVAFEDVCRRVERRERLAWGRTAVLWIAAAASLAAAALGLWPDKIAGPLGDAFAKYAAVQPLAVMSGAALVAGGMLLLVAALKGFRHALVILILFAVADQAIYGMTYLWSSAPQTFPSFADSRPVPPQAPGYRVVPAYLNDNSPALSGYRLLAGYAAMWPAKALDYEQTPTLVVAGVRWRARETMLPTAPFGKAAPDFWIGLPGAMPRARLVGNTLASWDPRGDITNIDVSRTAITTENIVLSGGEPGTAAVTSDRPGRIEVRTDAQSRQLLVVSESYYDGWEAWVDGRPDKVIRVYGDFMGVVLDAGKHSVRLAFQPENLRSGRNLSLAGLVLTAVFAIFASRRERQMA
jgi:hypothetical protein